MNVGLYALGLSPVVLFIPRTGIRSRVPLASKLHFFASLGNDKPASFQDLERKLWQKIVSLAIGSHRTTIRGVFAIGSEAINRQLAAGLSDTSWFQSLAQLGSYEDTPPLASTTCIESAPSSSWQPLSSDVPQVNPVADSGDYELEDSLPHAPEEVQGSQQVSTEHAQRSARRKRFLFEDSPSAQANRRRKRRIFN